MHNIKGPAHRNPQVVFSIFEGLQGARILTCFIYAKLYDDFAGSKS